MVSKYFLNLIDCLCILLIVSFAVQKLYFDMVSLVYFCLVVVLLVSYPENMGEAGQEVWVTS